MRFRIHHDLHETLRFRLQDRPRHLRHGALRNQRGAAGGAPIWPVRKRAKKSIANFGLRQGQEIGAAVTLRGPVMWEFLDRFVSVAIPRIRDFRGLSTRSFDGRGNYSLGLKEQMMFPEINYDDIEMIHGMDITIVTSATRDDHALALLKELGMPFKTTDDKKR